MDKIILDRQNEKVFVNDDELMAYYILDRYGDSILLLNEDALSLADAIYNAEGRGWIAYLDNKPTDHEPTDYLVKLIGGGLAVMLWLPEYKTFWYDPLDRYYSEDEIEKYRRIPND